MQIAFDFVKGMVSVEDFIIEWKQNPKLRKWIQSLVISKSVNKYPRSTQCCLEEKNFSVEACLNDWISSFFIEIGDQLNIHSVISDIVCAVYPEVIPTTRYRDEYRFFLTVMGDCLGGPEVDNIIWEIVKSYPAEMGRTKRKKAVKEKLKEVFHLEKGRYPIWVQDAEWPAYEGRPMQYVSRKHVGDSDLVLFTFRDVETGKTRVVEQCY